MIFKILSFIQKMHYQTMFHAVESISVPDIIYTALFFFSKYIMSKNIQEDPITVFGQNILHWTALKLSTQNVNMTRWQD